MSKKQPILVADDKSKFKKYKFPYEEDAKKFKAKLAPPKTKPKKALPIAIKKKEPKKKSKGYFSYSREGLVDQKKGLKGKFSEIWSRKKASKMLVTKKKKEKETVPINRYIPGKEDIFDVTRKHELLKESYRNIEKINLIRSNFNIKVEKIKEKIPKKFLTTRGKATVSGIRGRVIRHIPALENMDDVAILPTLRNILTEIRKTKTKPERFKRELIMTNVRFGRPSVTYIFVLDLSESMVRHLKMISNAILTIHSDAFKHRDRVGVIAVQGKSARVVLEPITNLYAVAKTISNLRVGGSTPLASGLLLAKQMVDREKRRTPRVLPIIVLITDGLATVPLTKDSEPPKNSNLLFPAQTDVLRMAKLIAKTHAVTIVINPFEEDSFIKNGFMSPTLLTKKIVEITNGIYFGFKTGFIKTEFTQDNFENIIKRIREEIIL